MSFISFVAKRHLLSKKSRSAIAVISWIAMVGIGVSSMALVVVLSVFNGIEKVVGSAFSLLDTDLRVVSVVGKGFDVDSTIRKTLNDLPQGSRWGSMLVENALVAYDDRQHIIELWGIDSTYAKMVGFAHHLYEGDFLLYRGSQPLANVGAGVAYLLGVSLAVPHPIILYVPNRLASNWLNPTTAFVQKVMRVESILNINSEFDANAVVVPIALSRELLRFAGDRVTAVAIDLPPNAETRQAQKQLSHALGSNFKVLSKIQQNENMYRTMKSERLIVSLILSLILLIATFNVVGSLSMLMIDKRRDTRLLMILGATSRQVRNIFVREGCYISLFGGFTGILLGLIVCWIQQTFGIIRLSGSGTFLVDAYPVSVQFGDVLLVALLVLALGFLAAWIPARMIARRQHQATI